MSVLSAMEEKRLLAEAYEKYGKEKVEAKKTILSSNITKIIKKAIAMMKNLEPRFYDYVFVEYRDGFLHLILEGEEVTPITQEEIDDCIKAAMNACNKDAMAAILDDCIRDAFELYSYNLIMRL